MNAIFCLLVIMSWSLLTLSGNPLQELQPPATTTPVQKSGLEQVNKAQPGEYPLDTLALKSVLPLPKEVSGYVRGSARITKVNEEQNKEMVEKGILFNARFSGARKEGIAFNMIVFLYNTPNAAREDILEGIVSALPGGEMQEQSHFGGKIGEKVWSSGNGANLVVLDGRVLIEVKINRLALRDATGNLIRDAQGNPVLYQITEADMRLAEKLATDTLERLTVLGVTSKPAKKATVRAWNQVKERRDDLMRGH